MTGPLSTNNSLVRGSMAALRRAGLRAREIARATGTPLVVVRDGKIVEIMLSKKPSRSRRKSERRTA